MRFSHAHVVGALFGQHELYGPSRTLQCMRSMRLALCSQSCCLDVGALFSQSCCLDVGAF